MWFFLEEFCLGNVDKMVNLTSSSSHGIRERNLDSQLACARTC